jgi:hypothetical protein
MEYSGTHKEDKVNGDCGKGERVREDVRSKAATQVRVILTIDGTYPRERHEELHRRA